MVGLLKIKLAWNLEQEVERNYSIEVESNWFPTNFDKPVWSFQSLGLTRAISAYWGLTLVIQELTGWGFWNTLWLSGAQCEWKEIKYIFWGSINPTNVPLGSLTKVNWANWVLPKGVLDLVKVSFAHIKVSNVQSQYSQTLNVTI